MKKVLFGIILSIISTLTLHAQDKSSSSATNFSLGLEASLPVSLFANSFSFGIGGSLQVEHKVANSLGITVNGGYIIYSLKSGLNGSGFGVVPLMAGAKYYFSPQVYGHAQLGAAFGTTTGGGTYFAYSPGIGFVISKNIDALIKYVGWSASGGTLGSVGLRLAYTFGK